MNPFAFIAAIIRNQKIAIRLFGREFQVGLHPVRQSDPVDHILWNILAFNLSGGVDRYSAQAEGFVAVLGFTVDVDLAVSAIGTGGVNLTLETPLFALYLIIGAYLPEPEEQPVRGRLFDGRGKIDG